MNKCLFCNSQVKNKYCSASCQLKYEYKNNLRCGKTITEKAHSVIRNKGHYKRNNNYLKTRNPGATIEARKKISLANSGEKNGMFGKQPWNKGPVAKKWWEEKKFKLLRKECLEKNNYCCAECGVEQTKKDLYCDHIIPYRICKKHELCNLQMLCGSCHSTKTNNIDIPLLKEGGYMIK